MLNLTNGVTHLVYEKDNEEREPKRNLVDETALYTRAELTIKDNNDVIIANPERHKYSIIRTWRYKV